MSKYIHGLHDPGGEWAFGDRPGWIVHTVALTETDSLDCGNWKRAGFANIVRLNYGYGSTGTIPPSNLYDYFADDCAEFVMQSPGVDWLIIGNEPNHQQEWPGGQKIEPTQYAKCFNLCYAAIRATGQPVKVMSAAVAPWNQQAGDWLGYLRTMLTYIDKLDGFGLHAYTHGTSPDLIYSNQKVEGWYWHFRTYLDQLKAIANVGKWPLELPAFITESDQDEAWRDANTGWICNALAEINAHNQKPNERKIHCLAFYRWQIHTGQEQWSICNRNGVIADFQAGVALGYQVSSNPEPEPEPEPAPEERRDLDPVLKARGVTYEFAKVSAGQGYWRLVKSEHLNEEEADAAGPDHHILGAIKKDDSFAGDIPFMVTWPSGNTQVMSKPQPYNGYNYDYPMGKSLHEYSIWVDDGNPSDKVMGIGMGANNNPSLHTSTWLDFVWTIAGDDTPAPPEQIPQVKTGYVTATAGLNVRVGPDTTWPVLGTLSFGSTVLYNVENLGWLHTVDGWVASEYVAQELAPVPSFPAMGAGNEGKSGPLSEATPHRKLVHPLPGCRITQHFYENPDYYAKWSMPGHDGTDLGGAAVGTTIWCMDAGIVYRVDYDQDYGNYVLVFHPERLIYSMYCHCNELFVRVGQDVRAGEALGTVGSTGTATGPHLHLEIRLANFDGSYREDTPMARGRVDPETYCAMNGLDLRA